MFAVFYKNVFIDWWFNQPSDKEWIERTISAFGWRAEDVEVIWFDQRPAVGTVWSFDDQKRILFHKQISVERPKMNDKGKPTDEYESVVVYQADEPTRGAHHFKDGQRLKNK